MKLHDLLDLLANIGISIKFPRISDGFLQFGTVYKFFTNHRRLIEPLVATVFVTNLLDIFE